MKTGEYYVCSLCNEQTFRIRKEDKGITIKCVMCGYKLNPLDRQ